MRCMLCFTACFSANASDAVVLPLPVGVLSVYIPFGPSPAARHAESISQRFLFSSLCGLAHGAIYFSKYANSVAISSYSSRATLPPDMKFSVSK